MQSRALTDSHDEPRDPWALPLEEPECPPGWTTGPPDFVGIGAQRCGTSWWYRGALGAHPLVAVGRKELHFFDRYSADEVESDFAARYARLFPRPEGSITGEWTPDYVCAPWTLPLLAEAAPDARYLLMLRDPVERYNSAAGPTLKRLRESGSNALNSLIVCDGILHSMYHEQVQRAFEILGRDRVLVLQYERCVDDPLAQMQRTQRFLGLGPLDGLPRALGTRLRSAEKPALPARVRADLTSALADDVRKIAALCPELDPGLWPNFTSL